MEVTGDAGELDGFLFCPELTVNGESSVKARYLLTSGFYYGNLTNIQDVKNCLETETNLVDGRKSAFVGHIPSGLTVNGGTVQAEKLVGADRNGRISVNGGQIIAPAIGTSGQIFGYAGVIPQQGTDFVYTTVKTPAKDHNTVITINGGEVQIPQNGYLGGMRTSLDMTGGKVILGNGAVMGMNDSQKQILELQASAKPGAPSGCLQHCDFRRTGGNCRPDCRYRLGFCPLWKSCDPGSGPGGCLESPQRKRKADHYRHRYRL